MRKRILWIIALILAAAFSISNLQHSQNRNLIMLEIGRNELGGIRTSNEIRKGLQSLSDDHCRLSWQLALTYNVSDQTMEREDAFKIY